MPLQNVPVLMRCQLLPHPHPVRYLQFLRWRTLRLLVYRVSLLGAPMLCLRLRPERPRWNVEVPSHAVALQNVWTNDTVQISVIAFISMNAPNGRWVIFLNRFFSALTKQTSLISFSIFRSMDSANSTASKCSSRGRNWAIGSHSCGCGLWSGRDSRYFSRTGTRLISDKWLPSSSRSRSAPTATSSPTTTRMHPHRLAFVYFLLTTLVGMFAFNARFLSQSLLIDEPSCKNMYYPDFIR